MNEDFKFAKAIEPDVPFLYEVMASVYQAMPEKTWFCMDDCAFLYRHIAKEGFILKVLHSHEIAGFLVIRFPQNATDNLGCALNLTESEQLQVAHMESIIIHPKFRGLGLQRRLLAEAERQLQAFPIQHLLCTVAPDNTFSRNNFLKQGYVYQKTVSKYGGLTRDILSKNLP